MITKEEALSLLAKEAEVDMSKVSDGYHTFEELYEHRNRLFIALCKCLNEMNDYGGDFHVWRSLNHSDGTYFPGWFVLGIETSIDRQITYHMPESLWDDTHFAVTMDKAPEFDGHTPADVLKRLERL